VDRNPLEGGFDLGVVADAAAFFIGENGFGFAVTGTGSRSCSVAFE
jgi:hypothetical protein